LTLSLSLALHAGLVTAIAYSFWPGASSLMPTSAQESVPSMVLLRSKETPSFAAARSAGAKPALNVSVAKAFALPSPPPTIVARAAPATIEPALALETNPNAHIRALAPDSALAPGPAPQLNSAAGVVFILDISGSMYEPYAGTTRLALARQCLSRQIGGLKEGTPFAITLYALRACNSGPLVAASDATREAAVRFIHHDIDCGGGTNLPAGLASAQLLHPGALVLVTDGDLNSPAYTLTAKTRELLGPEGQSPAFTVIGIAPRSGPRAGLLLESLADHQGGTYRAEPSESGAAIVTSASSVIKPPSVTP
jgi:hypothetical protein